MKIAILTQPLNANYGGVLQNWALQFVLRQLGHEPVTIDYIHRYNRFDWLKASIKTLVLYPFPKYRRRFLPFPQWRRISKVIEPFILKRINLTHSVDHYSAELLEQYKPDAIVVGSDQVWRPMYNTGVLADMYLRFAKNYSCPKVHMRHRLVLMYGNILLGRKMSVSCWFNNLRQCRPEKNPVLSCVVNILVLKPYRHLTLRCLYPKRSMRTCA